MREFVLMCRVAYCAKVLSLKSTSRILITGDNLFLAISRKIRLKVEDLKST